MGSNEEYLDKLLQSVTNDEKPVEEIHEYSVDMTDEELLASLVEMYSEELADFKETEIIHKEDAEDNQQENISNENDAVTDVSADEVMNTEDTFVVENSLFREDSANEEYTSIDSDYMSQSDIEALLSSLQDDLSMTTTDVVNEEKIVEDFATSNDSVLEEVLAEPHTIEAEDADLLIPDKDAGNEFEAEENILKDMGIDNMSAEQIDELLNAASESEKAEMPIESNENEMNLDALFGNMGFADDFDPEHNTSEEMADLLGGLMGGNDDELDEISTLLKDAENKQKNDELLKNNGFDDDFGGNDLLNELMNSDKSVSVKKVADTKEEQKSVKEKKKKEKKPKKEKEPKAAKEGESFWKKLLSVFFEEDEEVDDNKVKIADGAEFISMVPGDENSDILAEMLNEDKQKGKKSKKKDKKKPDKNKKEKEVNEDGEEVIDPKEQAKEAKLKAKAEKKAAKKKAKEEKAEADRAFLKAQPSISTKRAMSAFMFAISLLVIIVVIYSLVPTAVEKTNARKAFYNKDYYKAYELLQGKELNDSDSILLDKVTCILKIQRKLDSYHNYVKMDKQLEALNLLMEAVAEYEEIHTHAKALSIDDEMDAIYDEILLILNGRYGISEEMAKEINACISDAEYTVRLYYIIEGKEFDSVEEEEGNKPMEDILPEEEDFLEGQ